MSLTNHNILSILIGLMAGTALWILPDHVRGDNQLFGANGTLLPALALAIILGLSVLDTLMNVAFSRRSQENQTARKSEDVRIDRASIFGVLLVTILAGLFAFTLRGVGYAPAALVLVLVLMVATGARNPISAIAVSVVAVALLYAGLRFGLGVHIQLWPSWAG